MAYRSKKRQPERRSSTRTLSTDTKFKTYSLPPDPGYVGPNGEPAPKSFSLPTNPPFQQGLCQLMQWGNYGQTGGPTGLGNTPAIGPTLQLNPEPPLSGQYAGTSTIDWVAQWGVQDTNGNFYMPASGNLNMNFNLTIWTNNGLHPYWYVLGLYPGMWVFSLRLYSKAIITKANGTQFEAHFEVKNFAPTYGTVTPPSIAPGSWMGPGPASFTPPSYNLYFSINQRSLSECLWKYGQLVYHPTAQPPAMIGGDANFGLDINQSVPVSNMWEYGDRILLGGIQAEMNPFWKMSNCSYAISFDSDGDGEPDNFYGNTVDPVTNAPTGPGNFGQNLTTMVPSESKLLIFN